MKKIVLLLITIALAATVKSQPLHTTGAGVSLVNTACPDFVFDSLLNYKKQRITISEWRGKPMIIDFWGTFCMPCIADMPKLEKFQRQFGDSLQILLVATDGWAKASQFYQNRKHNKKPMQLPCAVNRTAVDYFKVKEVSTYVWIDDKGFVKAITDYSQLTEENITAFVRKQAVRLRGIERHPPLDMRKKMLVAIASEMDSSNVLITSSFTRYLKGGQGGYLYPKHGIGTEVYAINSSINELYRIAYGDSVRAVPYSRGVIESARREWFTMPTGDDFETWKLDNTYCYQLRVPPHKKHELLKIMQEDLRRMFGAQAFFENRQQRCLVLKAEKDTPLLKANPAGEPKQVWNAGGVSVVNQPFALLFDMIRHYNQLKIVLDETGITGNVDVTLPAQMNDVEALNKALKPYGLHLQYEDRLIKMFVLKDPL